MGLLISVIRHFVLLICDRFSFLSKQEVVLSHVRIPDFPGGPAVSLL